MAAREQLEGMTAPYQIERIEISDTSVTVTYLRPEDVTDDVVDYRTRVIRPGPHVDQLIIDLVQTACDLVDAGDREKRNPPERIPGRRLP